MSVDTFTRKYLFLVMCIDGTHIRIVAPHDNSAHYVNRKGFYSLNALMVNM